MTDGRCLCGTIRYEVDGPFVNLLHWHSGMCRKHHGTPFATWAAAPLAKVVQKPARLGRVEVKQIAFGLRGLDVTVAVPDVEGGLDPIVEKLGKIKKVDNVEVVDVGGI